MMTWGVELDLNKQKKTRNYREKKEGVFLVITNLAIWRSEWNFSNIELMLKNEDI